VTTAITRARRPCDWCHSETGQDVYTIWITEQIQALVGSCCVRLAIEAQRHSASPKIAGRARELLTILESAT
jgi:hypothetical protein